MKILETFDLRSVDLRDGALYMDPDASDPGKLTQKTNGADGEIFTVEMPVEPDKVRRADAETDVAIGPLLQKPVTLETALAKRASEIISGTVSVTFETDSAGSVRRRIKVTKLEVQGPRVPEETRVATEMLERRLLSPIK